MRVLIIAVPMLLFLTIDPVLRGANALYNLRRAIAGTERSAASAATTVPTDGPDVAAATVAVVMLASLIRAGWNARRQGDL